MMHSNELIPVPATFPEPRADRLRLAVAAYLARFKGSSRDHTESDLRCYLPRLQTVTDRRHGVSLPA
jgi:hypothetical protein